MKRRAFGRVVLAAICPALVGVAQVACSDSSKVSIAKAEAHVTFLVETSAKDVDEVRRGLPQGAAFLAEQWKSQPAFEADLKAVQYALDGARRKVQDLRVAKSTFFAVADPSGTILRNDQEQDRMSGKPLFASFPALTAARERYFETSGSMAEASGVRAPRPDGQWIAGTPVTVEGTTRAVYVTGWSFSSYAYRLEFALRGQIRSELASKREENEPLVYTFVVDGKSVYGAPVSPDVSRSKISELDPLSKIKAAEIFRERIEITGRAYGLAVKRAPALGEHVGIAVLRSET